MNIAINTIPLLSPLTGIGKYTFEVARALREVDQTNEYAYFYGYYSKELTAPGAEGGGTRYHLKEAVKCIPVVGPLARRLKGVLTPFSGREFDLYFEPNFVPVNIRSRRTVVTVADFSFHVHPEWHPKDRAEYFRKQFWPKIRRADRIIVISDFIRRSAVEFGFPEEILETIHLGFDRRNYRLREDEEFAAIRARLDLPENFILFVGSLEPRKNLVRLIHAYLAMDIRLRREFKLVLVGFKGWENGEIRSLLQQAKGDIVYTGYVDEEDLGRIYNLAALFVYPTLYEGFGLPPLEAMACGCPVITSNVASLPEVCGDAVFYVDPFCPEDIAHGIETMLEDQDLRRELRAKGLARSALFSWETAANKHLMVFEECCR